MPLFDTDLPDADLDGGSDDADTCATWSLDELDRSADLGSLRAAWALGHDRIDG